MSSTRRWIRCCLALVALCCVSLPAHAAQLYRWNAAGPGAWTNPANWTPPRNAPAATDILQIDANTTPTPTLTNVPSETIGSLLVQAGATVTLSTVAPVTVGLTSSNDALQVQTGASLRLSGANPISLSLAAGATTTVAGTIEVAGGAHRLLAASAGAIRFTTGAAFTTNTGFAGNAFGASGTPGTVLFDGGSTYTHNAGANPFGLTAPNSKVTFATGSVAVWRTTAGFSSSGRTFADLRIENGIALNSTGSGDFTLDKLVVDTGCSFTHTGSGAQRVTIQDDLVNDGAGLNIAPGTGGIDFSTPVLWTGDREHSVRGSGLLGVMVSGAIHVASTSTLRVFNTTLTLAGAPTVVTVDGTLSMGESGAIAGPGIVAYGPGSLLELRPSSTGTYTVTDLTLYWPSASSPPNVTCAAGATVDLAFLTRTIPASGGFTMAQTDNLAPVTIAHTLQIDGTLAKTTGSLCIGAPSYGSAAVLEYTSGALAAPTGEWVPALTAGDGVPQNVTIDAGATVSLPAGQLYVMLGNLHLLGGLDTQDGATLRLNGDWRQSGVTSTLTQHTAWIEFAGDHDAEIAMEDGISPLTVSLARMRVAKAFASKLRLSNTPATNLTLAASADTVLTFDDDGDLALNGHTLTLSGTNAVVAFRPHPVNGNSLRRIQDGIVALTGSVTFVNNTTTHPEFDTTTEILLSGLADFGATGATSTLISGTLHLVGNGAVANHAADDLAATIIYDGVGSRLRGLEWATGDLANEFEVNRVIARGATTLRLEGFTPTATLLVQDALRVESGATVTWANCSGRGLVVGDLTIDAGGTLVLSQLAELECGSDLLNNGTIAAGASGALRFTGSGDQTLTSTPLSLAWLALDKHAGRVVLGTDLSVNAPAPHAALLCAGNADTLDMRGHVLRLQGGAAAIESPGATPVFAGDAQAQLLIDGVASGGSLSFVPTQNALASLRFAPASAAATLRIGASLDIWSGVEFERGVVVLDADTLRVHAGATTTRTDGWMTGALQLNVPAGSPSLLFPLGTDTAYLPVNAQFGAVTTAADLVLASFAGDDPHIATSGLDATHSVNRTWVAGWLQNAHPDFFTATVSFLTTDLDAGTSVNALAARIFDAPSWSAAAVAATTPATVTVSGMHAGSLALGVARSWIVTASATGDGTISPAGSSSVLDGASLSYTITPAPHYAIGDVQVDNVSVGAVPSYTFTGVHADHTIAASFVLVNTAPVITGAHDLFGTTGVALVSGVTVTDADGDAVTCSGVNLPAGATVSADGTFSWLSPVAGVYPNVTIVADDGFGGHTQVSFTVTITAPVGVGDDARAVPATAGLVLQHGTMVRGRIACSLAAPQAGRVTLRLYSARGRLVATLFDEAVAAGTHRVLWDAQSRITAGVYLLRAEIGTSVFSRHLVVLD